ncbi:hypothetical protein SPF06_00780 [Sinomonas sp. JGH33]|uniref:Integral membrane protein n=1 Tax=Sinomonas terricola TaxID=3110330 RepID=A0ABU5T0R7_9MICC|nr:hypothetical protein [Sinomonas sp. JGH33]MEA5453244.1 hypothetical protein [Sinomonas sp. JGH33]
MRTVLSALSVLLAVVLTAVAMPALWLERNVSDESGFVKLLEPMAKDADLQSTLVANLDTAVLSSAGVPEAVRPLARQAIQHVADGLVSDPGFPQAWTETLKASHRLNFTPGVASTNAFELELRPMADLFASKLGAAIGVQLSGPRTLGVQVGTPQQRSWLTSAQDLAGLSQPLALGAALALLLGLLFARRRGVPLAWAGLCLMVTAAVFQIGTGIVPLFASVQASSGSMSSTFGARAAELAVDSFEPWIGGLALVGAALLVVGALLGLVRRLRRSRGAAQSRLASMEV